MENKTVFLNGQYLPLDEAKVSVLDRGFLFADGIYEVIPSYYGKLFYLTEHINRLNNSLAAIRIQLCYSQAQWLEIFTPLLDSAKNQYIYLQITRGVAPKRDHAFPASITPTIFVMCSDIVPLKGIESGVKAISVDDSRWDHCHIKAISLLANILQRQDAIEAMCTEAILVKDGCITEGAASNVFAVIDGVLITPPQSNKILSGITRDIILELATKNNIPYREDTFSLDELKSASEIWVTSSTREIIPVTELDGKQVADGKPGVLWYKMNQLFQTHKQGFQ